jgi:hypothetical protein
MLSLLALPSSRKNWLKGLLGVYVAIVDIRNVGTVARIRAIEGDPGGFLFSSGASRDLGPSAFLVDEGELMIVASTIVPVTTLSPLAARSGVSRRITAGPDRAPRAGGGNGTPSSHPAPARGQGRCRQHAASLSNRKRLFDRRVRQIEPELQEINVQHPLDPRPRPLHGFG